MPAAATIYLDSSALQRPLDRLRTTQEVVDSDCVLWILERCRDGRTARLEWSSALEYECIVRMPPERVVWARGVRALAAHVTPLSSAIELRARNLEAALRLSAPDALHVASAESAGALLVTVDQRLLRRCLRRGSAIRIRVTDPITAMGWLLGQERK